MNQHLSHMKQLSLVLAAAMLILAGCAGSKYHAGNRSYEQTAYDMAAKQYQKALDMKPNAKWAPDAKRKLADTYRQLRNTAEAERYYKEVVDMPDATSAERIMAARVMMSNGHYSDARVQLKQYLDQVPTDQNAQKLYASLDSLTAWRADSATYTIGTPNINGGETNISPAYYKEGVVFASDRGGSKKKYERTGRPFLDMYYAKETAPGTFDNAEKLKGKINDRFHDGPGWVSADGKTIYFTRTNSKGAKLKRAKKTGIVNNGLYQATLAGDEWTDIKPLPFNSDDYSCAQPAISADGNTLYFASDMPGGQGGTDIWSVGKRGDDWGTPQNLGSVINTPMNEMFPTVNGSDLYFSSEGHYNMGGLDIFKTRFDNGAWATPENAGIPLNTAHDDFGLITKDGTTGYLTSNRNSSDGRLDNILNYKQDLFFNLTVLAVMKADQSPLGDVSVELLNKTTGEKETGVTGADGKVHFKLKMNSDYTVLGSKQGFFSNSAEVSTVGKTKSEDMGITLVLEMEVMKVNEPITIKNIYYDFNKANIRPDAAKELDGLVKKMQDNPTIVVELASHTDSRGSAAYNQKLSQRRAQAAVNYITSKGIDKKKITAKGYGETKLLNKCKDGVKCTEDEHQLNRRTEFTVTGFTDQPINSTK